MCARKYINHSKCRLLMIINIAVYCCSWHFCTFFPRYYVAFICLYYQPAKTKVNDLLWLNADL